MELTLALIAISAAVMIVAGMVKGMTGFALPMVAVSGIGTFVDAQTAIAALIVSAVVTNVWQAFSQGVPALLGAFRAYWRLHVIMVGVGFGASQLVTRLPSSTLFLVLGVGLAVFGSIQLAGWRPRIPDRAVPPTEVAVGTVSGVYGGMFGVWGPPIVLYLIARRLPTDAMVLVQGANYMLGSFMLVIGHAVSGLLNATTLPFSALMAVPALAGMWAGTRLRARVDAEDVRRIILVVIVLAGLNLIRRALM